MTNFVWQLIVAIQLVAKRENFQYDYSQKEVQVMALGEKNQGLPPGRWHVAGEKWLNSWVSAARLLQNGKQTSLSRIQKIYSSWRRSLVQRSHFLLAAPETGTSPAEQIYYLYKMEEEKKAKERRSKMKKSILFALAVVGGYIMIYLVGRIFGMAGTQTSVMGWLFENDPKQLSYLYGWLLRQNMFWVAMAISTVPALFGKKLFSFTTLFGFAIALLLGELCGYHPAGAAYGHGHYGWLIWGGIFAFSAAMGVILEKMSKGKPDLKSSKQWIWLAVFVVGMLGIVFLVRASMPVNFS